MAVEAKYAGNCKRCHQWFPAGTMIEKSGLWWIPVDCPGCAKIEERREIFWRLEKELLNKANIAMGCWGIPEDAQPTFSNREWLQAAIKHNIGTNEEHNQLRLFWAGSMDSDLSD